MPPRCIQNYKTLMFSTDGGKTLKPLGTVTETDLVLGDPVERLGAEQPWPSLDDMSFSFTVESPTVITRLLHYIMPNNWLKMHGYPMRRKH